MPVKTVPTLGWTTPDPTVTVLLVTRRQREEMGARVALLRDERGWSNEALARASGLSVKTVSRFINATHEARMATVDALAKGLDVPETAIRGDGPAPFGPTASEDHLAAIETKFEGLVADVLERLDGQDQIREAASVAIHELLERQSLILERIERHLEIVQTTEDLLVKRLEQVDERLAAPRARTGDEARGRAKDRRRRAD